MIGDVCENPRKVIARSYLIDCHSNFRYYTSGSFVKGYFILYIEFVLCVSRLQFYKPFRRTRSKNRRIFRHFYPCHPSRVHHTHIRTLTPTGSLKSKTRPTAPHPRSLQQRHYIITHEAACAYNSSLLRGPLSPLALRSPVQFSPLSLPRKRSSSKEERDCTLSLSHTYTLHLPTHPCI